MKSLVDKIKLSELEERMARLEEMFKKHQIALGDLEEHINAIAEDEDENEDEAKDDKAVGDAIRDEADTLSVAADIEEKRKEAENCFVVKCFLSGHRNAKYSPVQKITLDFVYSFVEEVFISEDFCGNQLLTVVVKAENEDEALTKGYQLFEDWFEDRLVAGERLADEKNGKLENKDEGNEGGEDE